MPNLFKALGGALSSNAFQGVAQGLSSDLRRRKVFDEIKEQKDDRQAERDFVSQLNLKLLDGDPEAAQAILQAFSGRIPANTFSEGARLVRGLRSEIEQKGVADKQAFDEKEQARFQVDALSKGATPQETALLGEAGRQGQGLAALLGVRKQREQAAQDQGADEAFVQRALGQGVDPKQVGILRTLGRGARGADLSNLAGADTGEMSPKDRFVPVGSGVVFDRKEQKFIRPGERGGQGGAVGGGDGGVLTSGGGAEQLEITPETPTEDLFAFVVDRTGKAVPADVRKRMEEHDTAMSQLDELESELSQSMGLLGISNKVPFITNFKSAFDPKFAELQAVMNATKQTVGKAMEGGVLRLEDEKKYDRILPIISDTPAQAAAKMEVIKKLSSQARLLYAQNLISGLTGEKAKVSFEQLDRAMGGQLSRQAPGTVKAGTSGGGNNTVSDIDAELQAIDEQLKALEGQP